MNVGERVDEFNHMGKFGVYAMFLYQPGFFFFFTATK